MRIAVTGGSGFIGREVIAEAERQGHEVWRFDRADGHDILGNLSALKGAERVIHLAGVLGTSELFDDVEEAVDINVRGAARVLDWCTGSQAGFTGILMPDVFPSVYTATKVAAARLATAYHKAYGLPVSHVRAFNAHGPGQKFGPGHPQKILPTFATYAWKGRPLPVWGDGTQTVDLVTTRDLAKMLVDATRFDHDEVFDGGTGRAATVNEVASFVIDYVESQGGPRSTIVHTAMRIGEEPTQLVASGEGWDKLGWHPTFDWADVEATVDSYRPEPAPW